MSPPASPTTSQCTRSFAPYLTSPLTTTALSIWRVIRANFAKGIGIPEDSGGRQAALLVDCPPVRKSNEPMLLIDVTMYVPARLADDDRRRKGDGSPGTAVITKTRPQTKRPNLYRVLLLNDDY